jgi:hypothetical protein
MLEVLACQTKRSAGPTAAFAATIALLLATAPASSKVIFNTIDPVAVVADDGQHLVVTGPLSCTPGERAYLRVTVTQRETGAVAEGNTTVRCTGNSGQGEVDATVRGRAPFLPGPATAVASARTRAHHDVTDSHQWLVNIMLVAE